MVQTCRAFVPSSCFVSSCRRAVCHHTLHNAVIMLTCRAIVAAVPSSHIYAIVSGVPSSSCRRSTAPLCSPSCAVSCRHRYIVVPQLHRATPSCRAVVPLCHRRAAPSCRRRAVVVPSNLAPGHHISCRRRVLSPYAQYPKGVFVTLRGIIASRCVLVLSTHAVDLVVPWPSSCHRVVPSCCRHHNKGHGMPTRGPHPSS